MAKKYANLLNDLTDILLTQHDAIDVLINHRENHPELADMCSTAIKAHAVVVNAYTQILEAIKIANDGAVSKDAMYERITYKVAEVLADELGREIPFDLSLILKPNETIH